MGDVGDFGVEIQQMKKDAGDTAEGLVDDKNFLEDLDKHMRSQAETL